MQANPSTDTTENARDYEVLFKQYLEVCNRAIERNRHKFPYTEIWGARLNELEEDMIIEALIYDDRPKAAFVLRLTKEMKIEIVEKKNLSPEDAWPFSYQYLKRVVNEPEDYLENPSKLEWGWLQSIFGPLKPDKRE